MRGEVVSLRPLCEAQTLMTSEWRQSVSAFVRETLLLELAILSGRSSLDGKPFAVFLCFKI